MKKLLIHVCCAPCFIAPYNHLSKNSNLSITGFWFNPNIHPYQEYDRRYMALKQFAIDENINVIWKDDYNLKDFLRKTSFREEQRCLTCYYDRMKYTAHIAKKGGFDCFSTTLLYSKYQNHKVIIDICQSISRELNIEFYYQDFREFWKEGIQLSKQKEMYRQQYCGCIYSEQERYENHLKRQH